MRNRFFAGALLVSVLIVGGVPLPRSPTHSPVTHFLSPTAEAKSKFQSLLDRVLGESLPDGIYKTNGRLEATQVDVAAKYPGRLIDITVEEGSEVKAGQVVGRVSSPEYEAQLRAAQSNLEKAKQALAEAESLIDQRKAVLAAAKSDFERGQELVGKQILTQQTFDQRRRNFESAEASVTGRGRAARTSRCRDQERAGRGRAHRVYFARSDSAVSRERGACNTSWRATAK